MTKPTKMSSKTLQMRAYVCLRMFALAERKLLTCLMAVTEMTKTRGRMLVMGVTGVSISS